MTVAALLAACPPPGGGGNPGSDLAKTYTTTVSGKVTTPAGNTVTQYDAATRRDILSADAAKVWASTASTTKVAVKADGSYTLTVTHPGTFTLNVDYPAGRDYKAGAPQSVTTTAAAHTQDIALKYGYTITLSGIVAALNAGGTTGSARNNATVTVAVEGREVGSTTSSGTNAAGTPLGNYRITFDHPGTFRVTASFTGLNDEVFNPARLIAATHTHNFVLRP